jgi:hypothetical protein
VDRPVSGRPPAPASGPPGAAYAARRAPAPPPPGPRPTPAPEGGPALWLRRRRTRSHLGHLPKWTARRPEPFGIGGLHWLPVSPGVRDPALVLHGAARVVTAAAEMSPGVLRGPDSGDLGPRLATVLGRYGTGMVPVVRVQLLHQVPGPAGRTRSFVVVALDYTPELVSAAARFAQGERGLTALVTQAVTEVFAALSRDGAQGARLGPLVPLDRAALAGLLGSLVLPGRAAGSGARPGAGAWQPVEVDALEPRSVAMTAPTVPGQNATWWHATAWVKRWPRAIGGLDVAGCAGFLPPGVSGAASIVLGLIGSGTDRVPAVAGYVTVSGRDGGEVELARVAAHAAAEQRDGFLEFCDRRHHLVFSHTLPLATGLGGV